MTPPLHALGMGCRRGTPAADLLALLRECCAALGWAEVPPGLILATAAAKADEPGMQAVADILGRPWRLMTAPALAAVPPALYTPSPAARRALGLPSVAEAAALAACAQAAPGQAARLILPRRAHHGCTGAIAQCASPPEPPPPEPSTRLE